MSYSKVVDKLETVLKCENCQKIVKEPKFFACFYGFCTSCSNYFPQARKGGKIGRHCPVCNAFSEEKDLKPSLLVNELLDMHHKIETGKIVVTDDMVVNGTVYCSIHNEEKVIGNCKDHEVTVCMKCIRNEHKDHYTESIDEACIRLQPGLKSNAEKLHQKVAVLKEEQQRMSTKVNKVKASFEKCRDEARNNLNEAIEKLKIQHNELVKQLKVKEDEEVSKLEATGVEIENKEKEVTQICQWAKTCMELASGATLINQIQDGLNKKVLSSVNTNFRQHVALMAPQVSHQPEELNVEVVVGTVSYTNTVFSPTMDIETNEKVESFREVFAREPKRKNQIVLPEKATRMAMVNGNIWIPIPSLNNIQVIDKDLNVLRNIPYPNNPRSVKQAQNGNIILGSAFGLEIIDEEGTVLHCISKGSFCDFSITGDQLVAHAAYEYTVWKCDELTGGWKQTAAFPEKEQKHNPDGTLVSLGDKFYSVPQWQNNSIHEYTTQGHCNQIYTFPNLLHIFLCGGDNQGSFIIANCGRHDFQLFQRGALQKFTMPGVENPFDALCSDDGKVMLVLHYVRNDKGGGDNELTKYTFN